MPIKITSSLRKDKSARDFYKGEYVKCILIGEEKERTNRVSQSLSTIDSLRPVEPEEKGDT